MSYVIARPARAPTGEYYDVCASPRGDLLIWFAESGPQTWQSLNVGGLGIISFVINLLVFRRRWKIIVRVANGDRFQSPTSGVLFSRIVSGAEAYPAVDDIVKTIETQGLAAVTA